MAALEQQKAEAYKSIRDEYNRKLQEVSSNNRKVIEGIQKNRDAQYDQMRLYQAELQEKKQQEMEIRRLKENEQNMLKREKDLSDAVEVHKSNEKLTSESVTDMIVRLEAAKAERAQEINDLVELIVQVTAYGKGNLKGGEKFLPTLLKERIKEDHLKKLKTFFDANKLKM